MPQQSELLSDADMDQLAADSPGLISDADMDKLAVPESFSEGLARKGIGAIKGAGQMALEGVNKVSNTMNKFVGAPIRAGIGALQEGEDLHGALSRASGQIGEDPNLAPTGKDIMATAGLPADETVNTHLKLNPFTGESLKVSPAGVAGGVLDAAIDPTTYIGLGAGEAAEKGLQMAPELASYLEEKAGNRAVKAATGESRAAIRKAAGVSSKGGKISTMEKNLAESGSALLDSDEAGGPVIKPLSTAKDIADAAAQKQQYFGQKIGEVGEKIDSAMPNAVSGQNIADAMVNYAASIPETEGGKALQAKILAEAQNFQGKQLSFKDAQAFKNQFKYEPQASDALISNKDVTNKLQGIISDEMDSTVDALKNDLSPETLGNYQDYKNRYRVYKNAAEAASQNSMNQLSRRMISPSSHGLGLTVGMGTLLNTGSPAKAALAGAGAAGANMLALGRGSSLAATTAKAVADRVAAAPAAFQKWLPALQQAAQRGDEALSLTHHLLMTNDPDYYNTMNGAGGNP